MLPTGGGWARLIRTILMKRVLFILLLSTLTVWPADPRGSSTLLRLSAAQLDEFDSTRWVTLTKDQQELLHQRAGVSPTRVQIDYDSPDGERAELAYNIALKTSNDQIKVLHSFLLSDEDAKKKRQENRRMVEASGPGTTKEIPEFAIDSEGKLWRWISRSDFESYIARDPKKIEIIYLRTPSSQPSKNTVASDDTLRQVTNYSKRKGVPTYVVSKH